MGVEALTHTKKYIYVYIYVYVYMCTQRTGSCPLGNGEGGSIHIYVCLYVCMHEHIGVCL